jgi:hypothetical protein
MPPHSMPYSFSSVRLSYPGCGSGILIHDPDNNFCGVQNFNNPNVSSQPQVRRNILMMLRNRLGTSISGMYPALFHQPEGNAGVNRLLFTGTIGLRTPLRTRTSRFTSELRLPRLLLEADLSTPPHSVLSQRRLVPTSPRLVA